MQAGHCFKPLRLNQHPQLLLNEFKEITVFVVLFLFLLIQTLKEISVKSLVDHGENETKTVVITHDN